MQQAEMIAHAFGFIQAMRRQQHRFANLLQVRDELEHRLTTNDIQAARGFVEQHHGRIVASSLAQESRAAVVTSAKRAATLIDEAGPVATSRPSYPVAREPL